MLNHKITSLSGIWEDAILSLNTCIFLKHRALSKVTQMSLDPVSGLRTISYPGFLVSSLGTLNGLPTNLFYACHRPAQLSFCLGGWHAAFTRRAPAGLSSLTSREPFQWNQSTSILWIYYYILGMVNKDLQMHINFLHDLFDQTAF